MAHLLFIVLLRLVETCLFTAHWYFDASELRCGLTDLSAPLCATIIDDRGCGF
jgi:hypothetical protein